MLRVFRASAPTTDEKWFFDKSVWQKMFRAMGGCGFDSMIFANARLVGEDSSGDFAEMRRWVLTSAPDYGITPYLAIDPAHELGSIEQGQAALRALLETYPDLKGLFIDVSGDAHYVQQVVVDVVDAVRPDASLYLEGYDCPESALNGIKRRANRPIRYSVKYSFSYLVDSSPDPSFGAWIDAVGAENIMAEIVASNFEPWTSFSYDAAENIASNLEQLGCDGFALQPISAAEWPHTSDTLFKHQWQRDLVWYSVWGGTSVQQLARKGLPRWLVRNSRLVAGFEAGSRILELLALYFAGDKQGTWRPQFCSVCDDTGAHLLSIEDMLHIDEMPGFSGLGWWQEITGDRVIHLKEYIATGTPEDAYGPEELIEELSDLSQQAVIAGEKGMRSNSGEKELPSLARDAFCMGRLGEFYTERLRAALSYARSDDAEACEHMTRALGLYREMVAVDSSHRGPFRVVGISGRGNDWATIVEALEAEQTDAARGVFGSGRDYPATL